MFSNSDRWYFTKEHLNNSPSRRYGIDADKELAQRQQAANFIQDMGQRLQVTQLCINTAIVYMHRYYMFHSFTHFHRNTVATACLFLAAKVEEQPRKLEHIIKVAVLCLQKGQASIPLPPPPERRTEFYAEQAQEVIQTENILLQTLGFDVAIDHPHTYVVKCCHLVGASKDLSQTSYFMASNSLHLTTMCLQYKPTVVACFCIHLACKWSNWEIPVSSEGKPWFFYVDPGVTQDLLERLTEEFLIIFDKCPSRLKKRIMLLSYNQNTAGGTNTALSNYPFDADCRKAMQKRREESAAAKQADVVFSGTANNATVKVTDGFNGATVQNISVVSNVTKQINAVSSYNSVCTNSGAAGLCSGATSRQNAIPSSNVGTVAVTAGVHSNSYSAAATSHHSAPATTYTTAKLAAIPHKATSNNFAPVPRQKVISNNNINSNHNNGAHHTSQTSEHRKSATGAAMNFDSQQVRHHRKDGIVNNATIATVGPGSNGNGKYVAAAVDSSHSDIISNVVKEVVLAKQNEKLNCLKVPKKEKTDYNNSKTSTVAANVDQPEQKSHSIFSPTFSLTESDNSASDAMFFERSSCGAASVGSLESFSSAMRAASSPPAPPPKNLNDRYLQRLQKQEQNKASDSVCSNHLQMTNSSTGGKADVAGSEFDSYDKIDSGVAFDINDVIIGEDVVSNASSVGSPPAANVPLSAILGGGSHCALTDNDVAQSDAVNNCSSQVSISDVTGSDDIADVTNDNCDADNGCAMPHKKKKKHKEKDKHRDKEKKHHKEKKKHKDDKHHHHHHRHHHHGDNNSNGKEHEEQSLVPAAPTKDIVEPIKITIPKEKLKDIPMRLKIKINKDQLSTSSVTDSGPFKFKIGKEDGKKRARKRSRADSDISADSYSSNSEDELRSSKRTNYYLC